MILYIGNDHKPCSMKSPYFKVVLVVLLIAFCRQACAFTLIIKSDDRLRNLKIFEHVNTFPFDVSIGVNKLNLTNYPNAIYLMHQPVLKNSGNSKMMVMIWIPSETSSIEIKIDSDYAVVFSEESSAQLELNSIFRASNKISVFPYKPDMARPLEPILALEAKSIIQNSKSYTERTTLENLIDLSKSRNINNWSTLVITAYLNEPADQIYSARQLKKVIGLDSLENSVDVKLNTNKFMLVHVSGSWCGPCVKGLPDLRKSYDKVNLRVEFVSLWNDTSMKQYRYLHQDKKQSIIWTSLWDRYGLMASALQVTSYPTYILFDKSGVEIKRWEGKLPGNLEEAMDGHLDTLVD